MQDSTVYKFMSLRLFLYVSTGGKIAKGASELDFWQNFYYLDFCYPFRESQQKRSFQM